jgi:hypothetical protein
MFPTAGSQIYRNDDGEVLGWDGPSDGDPDIEDFYNRVYDYDDDLDGDCPYGCGESQVVCTGECAPVCGADLVSYTSWLNGQTVTPACEWKVPASGECPNKSSHA